MKRWSYFTVPSPAGGKTEYRIGLHPSRGVTQEKIWVQEKDGKDIMRKAVNGDYDLNDIEVHGGASCYLLTGWKTLSSDDIKFEEFLR